MLHILPLSVNIVEFVALAVDTPKEQITSQVEYMQ